ncbi:hypothetical protein PG997_004500 [Apiospora hydei]|uniref:AB hydrolase-1 domain-containing protein n=1 Tax=Apiospora hydei TaxID=1337664 RepID=A0ABR1X2I2_9PEZI
MAANLVVVLSPVRAGRYNPGLASQKFIYNKLLYRQRFNRANQHASTTQPLALGGGGGGVTAAVFFLAATALVSPALAARNCRNLTIPVHITAANTDLEDDFPTPQTDVEFTDFFLSNQPHGRQPPDTTTPPKTRNVTGDYRLAATYCEPSSSSSSSSGSGNNNTTTTPNVLQILTHGIGFGRDYWDFAYHDYKYSYVNHALAHGYATLAWDRLGFGNSTRLDPVHEVQLPLEVEALRELTRLLRAGEVNLHLDTDTDTDSETTNTTKTKTRTRKFDKIVHVGHSLGSTVVYALAAVDKTSLDGLVLTGWSTVTDFMTAGFIGLYLEQARPKGGHLAGYAPGYVVVGDVTALHTDFFAPGAYDPDILAPAYAATQPTTVGEIATGSYMANTKLEVTVPSLVITGQKDLIFCGTNCYGTDDPKLHSLLQLVTSSFPLANPPVLPITVPGSGHGLNLDNNHEYTYGEISNFLMSNGLSP